MLYSSAENGRVVFRLLRAAPSGSLCSYSLWSIVNVLFQRVSTSCRSLSSGLTICHCISDSISFAVVLDLKCVTILPPKQTQKKQLMWHTLRRLAHATIFGAASVTRLLTLPLIPHSAIRVSSASAMCAAVWDPGNFFS